jgi:hypothetical protein
MICGRSDYRLTTRASAANRSTRSAQDSNPRRRQTATFESQRVGFRWRAGAEFVMTLDRSGC